ncbi:MAG TPA: LysR family transcriptional regulator, partial [Ramlibacter sp.]
MDLNLLKVFAAVHQLRQVTAAAQHLDMTPSAVSNALTRLRCHVDDQLFVRTQRGVVPTPYADRLAESVASGLKAFGEGLRPEQPFAPEQSDRTFSINLADVGQMLMIGDVMRLTSQQARGIRIRTVDLAVQDVESALVRGDVDFAVGHLSS